jgi:hypothetical protein
MSKMRQMAMTMSVAAVVALGLAGCGGTSEIPGDAVAVVGETAVTKAALQHWTAVELATDYNTDPQQPVPPGVVYEPSNVALCVARLQATPPKPSEKKAKLSMAQLEHECTQHYRVVQEHITNVLIVFQWYIHEAEAEGVNPTEAEVAKNYARFSREHFPVAGELQKYLADTGEVLPDELMRMRLDMINTRLTDKEIGKLGGVLTPAQQHAYLAWSEAMIKRWVRETSCRHGYIVPNCKEYKGPLPPDPRI